MFIQDTYPQPALMHFLGAGSFSSSLLVFGPTGISCRIFICPMDVCRAVGIESHGRGHSPRTGLLVAETRLFMEADIAGGNEIEMLSLSCRLGESQLWQGWAVLNLQQAEFLWLRSYMKHKFSFLHLCL